MLRCSGEAKAVLPLVSLAFKESELKKVALAPGLPLAMLSLEVSMEVIVVDTMARVFSNLASSLISG